MDTPHESVDLSPNRGAGAPDKKKLPSLRTSVKKSLPRAGALDKKKWRLVSDVAFRTDAWETPDHAWDAVLKFVSKSLIIWEPFYCTGRSGRYIKNRGYTVYHEDRDFFKYQPDRFDIIVSNPPFSNKEEVFQRLLTFNKPFAMLIPLNSVANNFIKRCFNTADLRSKLQLLFTAKKVNFLRNGKPGPNCSFNVTWLCYGMGLPFPVVFADDAFLEPQTLVQAKITKFFSQGAPRGCDVSN